MFRRLDTWWHRRPGHILPFRIPFFRIFYSTTYTALWFLTLVLLAITPSTLLYTAIAAQALQYTFMIGGAWFLTAMLAIFIYSSRLYTNRSVLAGVGKAYIPVEDGEVDRKVRKMIVAQLERSSIVAWEARPRDALGEIMQAEKEGVLHDDAQSFNRDEWTVGSIIKVDPSRPPWGEVQHPGWTAPAQARGEVLGNLQFETVIAELPNLIEARAVSLAPADPDPDASVFAETGQPAADPVVVEILKRQEKMGLREYLTQLSYLGLINPPAIAHEFLLRYERARFGGLPSTETQFNNLMAVFAQLLEGMAVLSPVIIEEIRVQAGNGSDTASSRHAPETASLAPSDMDGSVLHFATPEPPRSAGSSINSPVTARTRWSRATTPYLQQMHSDSDETVGSVVRRSPLARYGEDATPRASPARSAYRNGYEDESLGLERTPTAPSDAGSVLHYDIG